MDASVELNKFSNSVTRVFCGRSFSLAWGVYHRRLPEHEHGALGSNDIPHDHDAAAAGAAESGAVRAAAALIRLTIPLTSATRTTLRGRCRSATGASRCRGTTTAAPTSSAPAGARGTTDDQNLSVASPQTAYRFANQENAFVTTSILRGPPCDFSAAC